MTSTSRREFLAWLGAAGAAAASGGFLADRLFAMVQEGTLPAPHGPGLERHVPTLCRLCPAGCGIRVRLVDGLPVGLEGDPGNALSAGGLCPAGLAGLHEALHPDRLRTPLRRDGPRGSGRWTAISWDEALEELARPLRRLRDESRPERFAVLERGDSPLTLAWVESVMQAFGSPNLVVPDPWEPWRLAWAYVAGAARAPAPDLGGADFILGFGHGLFETDGHPVWQAGTWGRLRGAGAGEPPTLACVATRGSPTSLRADLRVSVRPGAEGALALGLAHVLAAEHRVDRSFLERWTRGFEAGGDGTPSWSSRVLEGFGPEAASHATGVPAETLVRLARAFGAARRPVALVGPEVLAGGDGLSTAMAVVALNLLVGAVGRPGGFVAPGGAPLALPGAPECDTVARAGLAAPRADAAGVRTLGAVRNSAAGLLSGPAAARPYPLEVLLVHGVNPAHEWPGPREVERALGQAGLVAVMAPVADETARFADLVLPEAGFLESWQILPAPGCVAREYAGLQQPVLPAFHHSRSFEDAWFDLVRRLGEPVCACVPAGAYAAWLPEAAAGLFRSGRGAVSGPALPAPANPGEFWDRLRGAGSWIGARAAPKSPLEVCGAGVTRLEFQPTALRSDAAKLAGNELPPGFPYPAAPGSPEGGAPPPDDAAFPMRLVLFDTNTLHRGRTAGTPLLLELAGLREDLAWDSWVEVHPAAARRLGLQEGARVRVESRAGAVVARLCISAAVAPDVAAMPVGLGHARFGRFASGVGAHVMTLVAPAQDPWTGAQVTATRVRLAVGGA